MCRGQYAQVLLALWGACGDLRAPFRLTGEVARGGGGQVPQAQLTERAPQDAGTGKLPCILLPRLRRRPRAHSEVHWGACNAQKLLDSPTSLQKLEAEQEAVSPIDSILSQPLLVPPGTCHCTPCRVGTSLTTEITVAGTQTMKMRLMTCTAQKVQKRQTCSSWFQRGCRLEESRVSEH